MKIAICHSMQYAEKALEVADWFASQGHEAFPSTYSTQYVGLTDEEKEVLKLEHKYNNDAMREHWSVIEKSDRVLVLNYEKHGIAGYIGGNAFLEMGFAYILRKPIYLFNQIPEMPYYKTEIIATNPTVVYGDLTKVLE